MRRAITLTAVSVAMLPALSGCMFEVAAGGVGFEAPRPFPPVLILQGPVIGTPITGTYLARMIWDSSVPALPGCLGARAVVTLTAADGSTVTKTETGSYCDVLTTTPWFSGQYTVTGGTGAYAGATGSGTSTIQISTATFSFTAQQFGSFEVPGIASAATKRALKMRGTVSAVRRCAVVRSRAAALGASRRCKRVSVATLRRVGLGSTPLAERT